MPPFLRNGMLIPNRKNRGLVALPTSSAIAGRRRPSWCNHQVTGIDGYTLRKPCVLDCLCKLHNTAKRAMLATCANVVHRACPTGVVIPRVRLDTHMPAWLPDGEALLSPKLPMLAGDASMGEVRLEEFPAFHRFW